MGLEASDWRRLPLWAKTLLVLAAVAFACVLPEFAFLIDLGGIDLAIGFLLASVGSLSLRLRLVYWQLQGAVKTLQRSLQASWLGHSGGYLLAAAGGLLGAFWLAHWAWPCALWPALWPRL